VNIDPIKWLEVANQRAPKKRGLTPWFPGTMKPVVKGWYERHFTDSTTIPHDYNMQWWNGKFWSSFKGGMPHWRQVGDYPAWRGVTCMTFMRGKRKYKPGGKP
jgi:hypothetical protein